MVFLVFINVFYSTVVSSLGYQPPSGWEGDRLRWWKEPGVQLRYVYLMAT